MGKLDEKGTTMKIKSLLACIITAIALFSYGHVGSPGVVFEGSAGKYGILVSVEPPDVIPGVAEVSIYVKGEGVSAVSAKPIYWSIGDEGSPKSDPMYPVENIPGQYEGIVWFMQGGTASLSVHVEGTLGSGDAVVPIMAAATAQNEMEPELGWTLAGLGIFLTILMITIIGSAVSDGLMKPGKARSTNLQKKRIRGFIIATVFLGLILFGGKSWWDAEAATYQRYMYKPPQADSWIESNGNDRILTFQIDSLTLSKRRMSMGYLTPDHGKFMHMFIIKEGTLDVFAHLHPKRIDPLTFKVRIPDFPAGKYYVFGDIVRLNGYTETISDTLEIDDPKVIGTYDKTSSAYSDYDDTYIISNAFGDDKPTIQAPLGNFLICGKPGIETPLPDGSVAVFEHQPNEPFITGKVNPLTFAINDKNGDPANLEPYMGMMGHAVVFRKEGGVYVHLHPVGNYSMASQEIIEGRISESSNQPKIPEEKFFIDSINQLVEKIAMMDEDTRNTYLMKDMNHLGLGEHAEHGSTVTFPYSFPQAGNYRIWIQMKKDGKVLNSSFDAEVID